MITFFKLFAFLLLLGIAIFLLIYTDHWYECYLPNGGYFKIRYLSEDKKIETFYWQPETKAHHKPKKIIKIKGQPLPKKKPNPYF